MTYNGGFAKYVKVKEKYYYIFNDIVNQYCNKQTAYKLGATIEPTGVAYNGLFVRGGGVRPGGHCAVFGADPVGLATIALLKTSGAAKLFAFETAPERRQLALELGADYVNDPIAMARDGIDSAELLLLEKESRGISLLVECSSPSSANYPVMEHSLAIGGKTIQIGHTLGLTPVDIFNWQWNAGSISGSNGQSGQGIYPDVIALMASGRIDMRKMVTGRYNLEDIEEGVKVTAGKVLVSTSYPRL